MNNRSPLCVRLPANTCMGLAIFLCPGGVTGTTDVDEVFSHVDWEVITQSSFNDCGIPESSVSYFNAFIGNILYILKL